MAPEGEDALFERVARRTAGCDFPFLAGMNRDDTGAILVNGVESSVLEDAVPFDEMVAVYPIPSLILVSAMLGTDVASWICEDGDPWPSTVIERSFFAVSGDMQVRVEWLPPPAVLGEDPVALMGVRLRNLVLEEYTTGEILEIPRFDIPMTPVGTIP
jgi:hypothetical protein